MASQSKKQSRDVIEFGMEKLSAKLGKRMFIIFFKMFRSNWPIRDWVEIEG